MNLKDLKKEIPYSWKIQTKPKSDKKGACVAYIDSRDAQNLLDEVCGEGFWQSIFYEAKGKLFCKVGIKVGDEWIWKSDSGALDESESVESETTSKGETSDAFKRACVQWGIGRFLYEKEIKWITLEEYEANKYKLSDFCNGTGTPPKQAPKTDYKEDNREWLNDKDFDKKIVDWCSAFTTKQEFIDYANEVNKTYKLSKAMQERLKVWFEDRVKKLS